MPKDRLIDDIRETIREIGSVVTGSALVRRLGRSHPRLGAGLRSRLSRDRFTGLPQTLVAAAAAYAVVLFFGIAEDVLSASPLAAADVRIENLLYRFRSAGALRFAYGLTWVAEPVVVGTAVLVLTAYLWRKRRRLALIAIWVAMVSAEVVTALTKVIFHRERPDLILRAVSEGSFSFPSGHATTVTAFYGVLAYLLLRRKRSWPVRIAVVSILLLAIIAVDLSRLYLGVHFLSDVLAGDLVGAVGVLLAVAASERLVERRRGAERPSLTFPEAATALAAIALVALAVTTVVAPLRVASPAIAQSEDIGDRTIQSLFDGGELARRTETLIGTPQEPIDLILVAPEGCLEKSLASAGWTVAESPTPGSTARLAEAALLNASYPTAPMTPSFYMSEPNDYGFEKQTADRTARSRHHARFWRSGYKDADGEIYVGTASLDVGLKWGIVHSIAPDIDTERDALVSDLERAGAVSSSTDFRIVPPVLGKNFAGDQFFTDGAAAVLTLKGCSAPTAAK